MAMPFKFKLPGILSWALGALGLAACAEHQVRFQPWQGVPPAEVEALRQGDYPVDSATLLDAAATTLEHEPFLHWRITALDKANGLLSAEAGLFREVQLRVSASPDRPGRSRLHVNIPRRALNTRAKVWDCGDHVTAYPPKAAEGDCKPVRAPVQLDADYLRAFTWHVLHDRIQVPFRLIDAPEEEHPSPAPDAGATAP
jgi:hypothetical protein